jgi:hypothetical protein
VTKLLSCIQSPHCQENMFHLRTCCDRVRRSSSFFEPKPYGHHRWLITFFFSYTSDASFDAEVGGLPISKKKNEASAISRLQWWVLDWSCHQVFELVVKSRISFCLTAPSTLEGHSNKNPLLGTESFHKLDQRANHPS